MEQSVFLKWIQKYFPGITLRVVETLNDTKNPLPYLHRRFLRKDFSVDGTWRALSIANTRVAADFVAMDSSLPLKKRDSIGKVSGDIAKSGMEMKLNEKQLTDLDTLIAQGGTDQQILARLFQDTPKVIAGIWERMEMAFLQGLSTGITLVTDDENVGTGIRMDFGYYSENKFGVAALWATNPTTAKPFDDIQKVLDKASLDGNAITRVLAGRNTINAIAATNQAKEFYAFRMGFVGQAIPTPDFDQLNTMTLARYGFVFEIVDRSVRVEKDGNTQVIKPWADGAMVFLANEQVGSLVYARLAEQNHPVSGVEYQLVDDMILVSKFRTNRPSLGEWTNSQARVVPVIGNVDQIYLMDSKTVVA